MPTARISPEMEAAILALPGTTVNGRPVAVAAAKPEPVALIEATFRGSLEYPVWEIPLETRSEANHRDWRRRSKRTDAAWRAVSRALGKHLVYVATFANRYHSGHGIRVRITRIGGRKLDHSVNLPASMKAVEDAVAFMMGADDGSPLWHCDFEQEPGGAMGVRVELLRA